jgi:hypothetical protein
LANYDAQERERIRAALIGYMKEHLIGVPALATRIRQSHPREMEIPLKTLQRFLAGKRTQDMALIICAAFVANLPNKPTALQALADSLNALYTITAKIEHAGDYSLSATFQREPSRITLTPSGLFLTVKEFIPPHAIYDGLMFFAGPAIVALLRNRLMATLRMHVLHRDFIHGDLHHVDPFSLETVDVQSKWERIREQP